MIGGKWNLKEITIQTRNKTPFRAQSQIALFIRKRPSDSSTTGPTLVIMRPRILPTSNHSMKV